MADYEADNHLAERVRQAAAELNLQIMHARRAGLSVYAFVDDDDKEVAVVVSRQLPA